MLMVNYSSMDGISIHTLRVEGDADWTRSTKRGVIFQSTPSAWRVTSKSESGRGKSAISIHTLRVEGDGSVPS